MLELDMDGLRHLVEQQDYAPLFVTVSGAHLYGFPSPDSDVDLRGCHKLPLPDVVGLDTPRETIEPEFDLAGTEVELVSHDVGKYLRLLVRNNGYILEQVFSPIVIMGQGFLDELRPIAKRCITRHHYHHYRGFYATQRKLIDKEEPKRVKPVLYAYRVLMTGIHLLRNGEVEANLLRLNEHFDFTFLSELIAQKSTEQAPADLDWEFHDARLAELESQLDRTFEESDLPEDRDRKAVDELLVRVRLG
jgi:predicted nucleotidyltransferase